MKKPQAVRCNVMHCGALLTVGHYSAHYRAFHSEQGPWKKSMHEDGQVYSVLDGDDLAYVDSMTDSDRKLYNLEKRLSFKQRSKCCTDSLSESRQDSSETHELREFVHELTQRMDAVENRLTSILSS
ncbi:hypothetical protein AC1031_004909 [Aphanomyces cochlioides]|nr:hypothetical protein AC1031_004909 [Aphanomyces cochlioides]